MEYQTNVSAYQIGTKAQPDDQKMILPAKMSRGNPYMLHFVLVSLELQLSVHFTRIDAATWHDASCFEQKKNLTDIKFGKKNM